MANGLRVLVHEDHSTPLVCVNISYNVGSKHEDPNHTGFAHLFEHLMFGGSENIKDFDKPLQLAGGENNAFTNNDLTNFYDILPAENIETAFWLESDRMMSLPLNKKVLNTQKQVVIEEFKETCLNEPYGDFWHHMSALAYTKHHYNWPTIGKEIAHIAQAEIEQVKHFFDTFYTPDNAVLVVAGKTNLKEVKALSEKWFGAIPRGNGDFTPMILEPLQEKFRSKTVTAKVPQDAIFLGFPMSGRLDKEYYVMDLITDLLANGRSSRFYKKLYKGKKIFNTIDAFVSGYVDPGLCIIEGKIMPGFSVEQARIAIWEELTLLQNERLGETELMRLRNTLESSLVYSEVNILNKAILLAFFATLGREDWINEEASLYQSITEEDIMLCAQKIFVQKNCNELVYLSSETN
ncbi:MAG: pitrilysin family protein [Saprospiraceae bacterium]